MIFFMLVKNVWCLQKRDVRIIKSVPIQTESAPMFQSLELLSVFEIYTSKIALFMYKYVHNQVAICVNELFTRTNEIHNHITRQSDKFYIHSNHIWKSFC